MPDRPPAGRPDPSLLSEASSMCGAIVVLTVGGYWLDHKAGTSVVFTLIGAGLSLLYCVFEAWRMLNGGGNGRTGSPR